MAGKRAGQPHPRSSLYTKVLGAATVGLVGEETHGNIRIQARLSHRRRLLALLGTLTAFSLSHARARLASCVRSGRAQGIW